MGVKKAANHKDAIAEGKAGKKQDNLPIDMPETLLGSLSRDFLLADKAIKDAQEKKKNVEKELVSEMRKQKRLAVVLDDGEKLELDHKSEKYSIKRSR